jgi:hypothetical protein
MMSSPLVGIVMCPVHNFGGFGRPEEEGPTTPVGSYVDLVL